MTFKKDDKVYFGYSHISFVGIVLEATEKEVKVSGVELGCLSESPETKTISRLDALHVIDANEWAKHTAYEPAFLSRDQYLAFQRELEMLERANAEGHDTEEGDNRIKFLDAVMDASPWTLHPDYGCIAKTEVTLLDALEEVSQQLRDHPDVSRGNSKVHYCYHKAEGALKNAADRRVMP